MTVIAAGLVGFALPAIGLAGTSDGTVATTTVSTSSTVQETGSTTPVPETAPPAAATVPTTTPTAGTTVATPTPADGVLVTGTSDEKDAAAATNPSGVLGLTVTIPPSPLRPFAPGSVAHSSGAVTIQSPSSAWTLQVSDTADGSPAPGHLVRSPACAEGIPYLRHAMRVSAEPPVGAGTTSGEQALGATPALLAEGRKGEALVQTRFRQVIGADEVLPEECPYTLAVTFTVS
jgi:hypothetical protein